jgi:hypothetical protein
MRGVPPLPLRVAIPVEAGAQVNLVPEAIVFLSRTLTESEKSNWGITTAGEVYALTSGSRGWLPFDEDLLPRLSTYLENKSVEGREAWIRVQLASDDPYFQRSALLELTGVGDLEFPPETIAEILRHVVISNHPAVAVRRAALERLVAADIPGASTALENVARDPDSPDYLRLEAVKALPRVEGGSQILKDLATSDDPFVRDTARERARLLGEPISVFTPPSPRHPDQDEIDAAVRSLIGGDQPLPENLRLLRLLTAAAPERAATALQQVIVTSSAAQVRNAAFGKLLSLDVEVRRESLKELQVLVRSKYLKARVAEQLKKIGGEQ